MRIFIRAAEDCGSYEELGVHMKTNKISNRNTVFTTFENSKGGIVSMGLIQGKRHNFIIDTGIGGGSAHAMLEYIGDDKKPIIVINTHAHWDHIYGNWVFADSMIIGHKLCREIMDKNWDADLKMVTEDSDRYTDGEIHKCLPNMVFEGALHFPEDGITLFHSPGHTADHISVYDAVDKVLYIGDNFGVFDGVAYYWGEDLSDFERLIKSYRQCDFDICVPTHSEPQAKEVLVMLEAALKKAREEQK